MKSPLFIHDCNRCRHLGSLVVYNSPVYARSFDAYVCDRPKDRADHLTDQLGPCLIARFSDEGSDYECARTKLLERCGDAYAPRPLGLVYAMWRALVSTEEKEQTND